MTYDIQVSGVGTVYLPHMPEDADKVIRIRESMVRDGWVGRPVILQEAGDHVIAYTGSHRLAAVHGTDTHINAVWLPDDLTEDECAMITAANDDGERLAAFRTVSDARGDDEMADVIAAMAAEIEANE